MKTKHHKNQLLTLLVNWDGKSEEETGVKKEAFDVT